MTCGLPFVPAHVEHPAHMFYLLMPSAGRRDRLLQQLRERGILAVFHYLPLHASAFAKRIGARDTGCPVSEDVSARIVRLPFFTGMTEAEQDEVIAALHDVDRADRGA